MSLSGSTARTQVHELLEAVSAAACRDQAVELLAVHADPLADMPPLAREHLLARLADAIAELST